MYLIDLEHAALGKVPLPPKFPEAPTFSLRSQLASSLMINILPGGLQVVPPAGRVSTKASILAENRIDPEDGRAYTFDEMFRCWGGSYTKKEILAYWYNSTLASAKSGSRPSQAALTAQIKHASTIKDVI